jgi:hypothetical protein
MRKKRKMFSHREHPFPIGRGAYGTRVFSEGLREMSGRSGEKERLLRSEFLASNRDVE